MMPEEVEEELLLVTILEAGPYLDWLNRSTMVRAVFFLLTFSVILVSIDSATVDIGMNWGNIASHPLSPSIVVQMLKDNGLKRVKLFDADGYTVKALANTGIEVMLAIPNLDLQAMADDYQNAKDWVKDNVTQHLKTNSVNIKYIAVGNEPFLKSYNGTFVKPTLPALKNVQKALNEAGYGKTIKASVPLNGDVYESTSNLPSDGAFRKDVKDIMQQLVNFLSDNDAPFIVNIYPFLSLYENPDFPTEFAFFGNGKTVNDKQNSYTNVLDANYDTLLWALKKVGVPNLKIIIGEIGWPTDGNSFATNKNAQKFYDGLFKKLGSGKGTPIRPDTKFDIYLFGLLDEDAKSIAPGDFERHWGIFRFDGQPKFPIDFTGKGQNKMPVGAKNVKYLDQQWCVFDRGVRDMSLVPKQMEEACKEGDCTSIGKGGSCSGNDNLTKVSQAFNMYYQIKNQKEEACDFNGLAVVVKKNPSNGTCFFPIQIESGGFKVVFGSFATVFAGVLYAFLTLF
ncbi:glucan endo-1,3-beta-glucosidase 8-like [Pistacia vera]|uniref:glucan endo-1,3-beta-glucosidase 8-like n=1 Tax=Pistacia vera TaxID=55513 RepID=UPI0012634A3E|nr:glucan endo-1,3-beta-glucosidase 8-like [Pistacia vera]